MVIPDSLSGQFDMLLRYIIFITLAVIFKSVFPVRIFFPQRQNLSTIPGPRLASFTRLWIVKALASGKSAQIFVDTNKRYGSLARIGPKHLLTSDPQFVRRILAARSGYLRGPWYDSIRLDPHVSNIVSERDERKHNRLRYMLSSAYSHDSIKRMESVIDERLIDWFQRVDEKWASEVGRKRAFDIGKRIQFLTVDIITKLGLGKELGCVRTDSDQFDFLATVKYGNTVCQHFSVILELNTLMYYLTKIPFIGPMIVPKAQDKAGVGRIMGLAQNAINERKGVEREGIPTFVDLFLENGLSEDQVDAEMVIALAAGSDTTSTAVQSTLLAIISNPAVYNKLKSEVKDAVTGKSISYPISHAQAKELPFLQACVYEGLRKFPPLNQLRERVVPPEGDVIQGHRIPGGTFIGLNSWGTQLDEVFGDSPDAFLPERWLVCDDQQLKAMRETHDLVFGHGSTKCLGKSIAMMELSKMIFEIFRHFDLNIANPYQPWTSVCHGIFFQEDFRVYLTRSDLR